MNYKFPLILIIWIITGGRCEEGQKCDDILEELENIDDELDETGMVFVTTEDVALAKKHGIKSFPSLVLFRNKEPVLYKGWSVWKKVLMLFLIIIVKTDYFTVMF